MTAFAPPPIRSPLVDATGLMSAPWLQWFRNLYARTGGANGMGADELALMFPSDSQDGSAWLQDAALGNKSQSDELVARLDAVESALAGTMLFGSEIALIRAAIDGIASAPVPLQDESALNALRKRVEAIEAVVVITTGPDLVALTSKGDINLVTPGGLQAKIANAASAVNYIEMTGSAAGGGPSINAKGSDANITISIVPKGTGYVALGGNVRFGGVTGSADAPITGYVTIQDTTGTTRKLAIIA